MKSQDKEIEELILNKVKFLLPIILLTSFFINGCFLYTSRDEGDVLKNEIKTLNARLATIEKESDANKENLAAMIAKAQQQVESMEETLSRATRVLARNSADFGAEMDEVKNDLMQSTGAVAELTHEFELLKKETSATSKRVIEFAYAAGVDLPVDEKNVPDEAKAHFDMIKKSLSAQRYGECRSLARIYQDRYPAASNLDEVQLVFGNSYSNQKRYAKALGAYRRFADLYSKSKHMPEALYQMAVAFFKLGDCTDALVLVDTVISRYPKSKFFTKSTKLKNTMQSTTTKCSS